MAPVATLAMPLVLRTVEATPHLLATATATAAMVLLLRTAADTRVACTPLQVELHNSPQPALIPVLVFYAFPLILSPALLPCLPVFFSAAVSFSIQRPSVSLVSSCAKT